MTIKNQALLEHLVLQGAIEVSGFDLETGETLYGITDKLKTVSPKMYEDLEKTFRSNNRRMQEILRCMPSFGRQQLCVMSTFVEMVDSDTAAGTTGDVADKLASDFFLDHRWLGGTFITSVRCFHLKPEEGINQVSCTAVCGYDT